jgi:hypothetical protein
MAVNKNCIEEDDQGRANLVTEKGTNTAEYSTRIKKKIKLELYTRKT